MESSYTKIVVSLIFVSFFSSSIASIDHIGHTDNLNRSISLLEPFPEQNKLFLRAESIIYREPQVLGKDFIIADEFYGEITAYASLDPEAKEGMCYSGDPNITASGTQVREGVAAANFMEFGTKFMLPDLYGDRVFVVEDRMARSYGFPNIDIWVWTHDEAYEIGRTITKVQIIR